MDKTTNIGPVISRAAAKTITEHIADALAHGAIDGTPPNPTFQSTPKDGNYVSPRLLLNVTHDMQVMKEETFGPVIPVMKVSSDEEAVRLMNDSEYGLSASIWTADILRGEELLQELEAGTAFVNRCDYPNPVSSYLGFDSLPISPILTIFVRLGSCLDRLEEFGSGLHPGSTRVRRVLQTQEFPREGIAEIEWLKGAWAVLVG